jgi:ankyrin repeat protein
LDRLYNILNITALTLAADEGHTEICKVLIENGANVNHENKDYDTHGVDAFNEIWFM